MFKDEIGRKLGIVGEVLPFTLGMFSRRKTVVCGVKRVIFSSDKQFKIALNAGKMTIGGTNLKIVEMGGGDVFLEGKIDKIEFED